MNEIGYAAMRSILPAVDFRGLNITQPVNARKLVGELRAVLAPRADGLGNMQESFRLDAGPSGSVDLTYPTDSDAVAVAAVVAAHTVVEPPAPTPMPTSVDVAHAMNAAVQAAPLDATFAQAVKTNLAAAVAQLPADPSPAALAIYEALGVEPPGRDAAPKTAAKRTRARR